MGDTNSLSLSVTYNASPATTIVETEGFTLDNTNSIHHAVVFGMEYVTPLEGLAVSAQLPFLALKYTGQVNQLLTRHGSYDDGDTHTTLTDFRADVRYAPPIEALESILALAVHVAGTIPVSDYETQGFVAAGRGLKQLHFGLSVGRTLDPILPRLYFHARYEYSLAERFKTDFAETGDINQDSSTFSTQIGYFILDELQVNAGFNMRISHGGFNFLDWNAQRQVVRDFHDVLIRERAFLVGGGLDYEIIEGLSVNAFARFFVGGANTRNGHIIGGGVGYEIF